MIRKHPRNLKKSGDLRNAIVHDARFPFDAVAVPTEATLRRFEELTQYVLNPPRLHTYRKLDIKEFTPDTELAEILAYMSKNDYSQVIVRGADGVKLMTSEGISRWLENNIENGEIIIERAHAADVLLHEVADSFAIMQQNQFVDEAAAVFRRALEEKGFRLYGIITNDGTPHTQSLGILTPWDLVHAANGG